MIEEINLDAREENKEEATTQVAKDYFHPIRKHQVPVKKTG